MNDSLLEKTWALLVQHPFENMCTKFKVYRLSRFLTGACQVFTTQKPFPSEIPLTIKTETPNFF